MRQARMVARFIALLAGAAVLLGATTEIQTTAQGRMAVAKPAGTAKGSIILIPGGATTVRISADGQPAPRGNTVFRIRDGLLTAGFAIAYLEDPSDLGKAIASMREVARPVVLVGLSNGTIVEVDNGNRLGKAGPDLIVLMSTVTKPNVQFSHAVTQAAVARLAVPVLFVHNPNDRCAVSTIEGARAAAEGVPSATFLELSSAPEPAARQCDSFSPHGFLGAESALAKAIVDWIAAHATSRADQ